MTLPGCTRCALCKTRRHVCLYRGSLPCDVLFIGEAPGESEDALGYPFVGPAGKELDALFLEADTAAFFEQKWGCSRGRINYGITNIVGCIPRTEEAYSKGDIRIPKKDEVAACQPRLLEIIQMADPRAIVLLGDVAKRFFPKTLPNLKRWNLKAQSLIHPSAILRAEIPSRQSLLRKQFVIALANVLKELT